MMESSCARLYVSDMGVQHYKFWVEVKQRLLVVTARAVVGQAAVVVVAVAQ
jgi:hypothetical protein